ncbi:hypothetical protein [Candidatus Electronema sp. JM]|uniref:hypothetical protein n=1 Tax=Candidatus Electronema sp. JM TaxID=3401571 RepID=UPI003AA8EBEB
MKWSFAVISLACLLIPRYATAKGYSDQVKAQLALVKLAGSTADFEETHNDKFDNMRDGEEDSFSFTLRKGMQYKIVSACDEDCSDLDLAMYDDNDEKVSDDLKDDSLPVVSVTPRRTGKFTLKVKMVSCKSNPCYYGISILGK